ncbi:MAG: 50S ribosomal protein L11 methyltransferase [Bacteroidota bacterium]
MLKRWYRISLKIPLSYQDLIVGQLASNGLEGFLQEEDFLHCFVPVERWKARQRRDFNQTLKRFRKEFPRIPLNHTTAVLLDRNWNRTWEKSAGIVDATPRIVIKPSWKKLRKKDRGKMILRIDPKMSFGTGHHETTRLTLLLLEQHLRPKTTLLDFGCGTGVLAIAGAKLGASRVTALDMDPWSVDNARENVRNNRVGKHVSVIHGSAEKISSKRFDFIAANIDLPTITKYLPALLKSLNHGGLMVLAGLLISDLKSILPLLQKSNLIPFELVEEGEWVAFALSKV